MKPETLFDQVYEAYGPSLYRFCLLHMKNPSMFVRPTRRT